MGNELRLVLTGDFKILDGLGKLPRSRLYFLEEARIFDRMTAWSAKVCNSSICLSVNGRTSERRRVIAPTASPAPTRGTANMVW